MVILIDMLTCNVIINVCFLCIHHECKIIEKKLVFKKSPDPFIYLRVQGRKRKKPALSKYGPH